jgi:predicted transcriptional regulator
MSVIESRRQGLGLSREALGAAAGGVSSSTIRRIERGVVQPHPSTIAALIQALDAARYDDTPAANGRVGKVPDGDRQVSV